MAMKLLVVEDDPQVLQTIKSLIESLGYEVVALADSREAAWRVGKEKFEGAFLDARMPHLDGFSLTEAIRKSPSNSKITVVMLTGYNDAETMRAGFKAGVSFFLGKPPDLNRLGTLLKLMKQQMLREKRRYIRLPVRTVVHCSLGKRQFKSASLNVSEGGMLLEDSGGADVGQELRLRFSLPLIPDVLNPSARVTRKERSGHTALQFLQPSPEDRQVIQDFIAGLVKG
jgi:CheY-like chemotaxis protein